MATNETHELLVKVRPDGAEETREELEKTGEAFNDAVDETEQSAKVMTDFSKKFRGAMKVTLAGLAIATAGLLTKVPVISELFQGLTAIFQAVALQLDEKLRPAIQPITEGMFDLADAIASGDWGKVTDLVTDFAMAFANIDWLGLFNDAVQAVETFLDQANLRPVVEAMFDGIKKFVSFAASKVADFIVKVIRALPGGELLLELGGKFINALKGLVIFASKATEAVKDFLGNMDFFDIVSTIADGMVKLAWRFQQGIVELVRKVDWGVVGGVLKDEFLAAAKNALAGEVTLGDDDPGELFSESTQSFRNRVKDVAAGERRSVFAHPALPPLQGGGLIEQTGAALLHRGERVIPAADVDRGGGDRGALGAIETEINIDGRKIGEATKQFTPRGTLVRGRGVRFR